jgi:hypothetical protein
LAVDRLRELVPQVSHSEDAVEGLRSFVERRKGQFTGR